VSLARELCSENVLPQYRRVSSSTAVVQEKAAQARSPASLANTVSHDRYFLDRVISRTIELDDGVALPR